MWVWVRTRSRLVVRLARRDWWRVAVARLGDVGEAVGACLWAAVVGGGGGAVVVGGRRGPGQRVGGGSAARRAKAAASGCAHGQVRGRRSVARRAWKARRPAGCSSR